MHCFAETAPHRPPVASTLVAPVELVPSREQSRFHNVSTNRDDSGLRRSTPVHSRRVGKLLLRKGLVPETQRRQSVARSGRIRFDSFPAHHYNLYSIIALVA